MAVWPVAIKDHSQAPFSGSRNDLIHDFEPVQFLQIWIKVIVDPIRNAGGIKKLVAVREADGVETQLHDLVKDTIQIARPQTMRGIALGLEAEPVEPGQNDLVAFHIQDALAIGMQVIGSLGLGSQASANNPNENT